jgi:NAD(P)-dependent dehydrogenase (short-subunit alcohol dehydrogenase family)
MRSFTSLKRHYRTSVKAPASSARLRADKSSDHELRQVARETASARGIRVNGVAPGPIWTPLQISGGSTVQKYTNFGSTTSLGRPGQPAELASIYVQLAAKDASSTTGNIYGAGGGTGQP